MRGAGMAREHGLMDRTRLGKLAERIGAAMDARMVVLFGSRATGTDRHDSDVDIAIIDARRADSESGCRVLAAAGADEASDSTAAILLPGTSRTASPARADCTGAYGTTG